MSKIIINSAAARGAIRKLDAVVDGCEAALNGLPESPEKAAALKTLCAVAPAVEALAVGLNEAIHAAVNPGAAQGTGPELDRGGAA
jgi:hypothetical protein